MTVLFDYSTFLKEAGQIAKAVLAKEVGSTTQADYYAVYTSESVTDPADEQMFYSIINPGHNGVTSSIQYSLVVTMVGLLNSYKWQIRPTGGAWGDLVAAKASTALELRDTGVYTTPVQLPAEIQLLVTDAGAQYVTQISLASPCAVRCIGTV